MPIEVNSPILEIHEKPDELNGKNIIFWSASLRQLEGIKEGTAINTKALKFYRSGLVKYDKENKVFLVLPIKGYNKTTYIINNRGDNHFECNCQFYNKVSSSWEHPTCSHIEAVKIWLEIKRYNERSKK